MQDALLVRGLEPSAQAPRELERLVAGQAADAPQDLREFDARDDEMPPGMREALRELRLIDW